MKKMMNILVVLILIGSILPNVYADNSNNNPKNEYIDKETQQQTEIMNTNTLGAEIRLLQLEKAIIKNIEKGEQILTIINDTEYNITDLQVILAEFYLLQEEIQTADPNDTEAVSIFVDLKHDAVNLTKDFRETLRTVVNNSTVGQIQQSIRNMTSNQTTNVTNKIQSKIRTYNAHQFRYLYQLLGENRSDWISKYQNGSLTTNQVKQNLTKRIQQNKTTHQYQILTALKQKKIQHKIQTQNSIQNASDGFQQRQENRLKKRLQQSENLTDNPLYQQLTKRIQQKLGKLDNNTPGNNNDNGSGQQGDGSGNDNSGDGEPGQDDPDSGGENGHNGNGDGNNQGPGGGN